MLCSPTWLVLVDTADYWSITKSKLNSVWTHYLPTSPCLGSKYQHSNQLIVVFHYHLTSSYSVYLLQDFAQWQQLTQSTATAKVRWGSPKHQNRICVLTSTYVSTKKDIVDKMAQDLGMVSFPSSLVYQVRWFSLTLVDQRDQLWGCIYCFSLAGSFYGLFQYSSFRVNWLAAVNQFAI